MNSTSDALGEPGRSCNPRKPEDSQGKEAFSNFLCLSSQGHTLLGLLGAHMCPPCSEAFSVSCYLSSPGVWHATKACWPPHEPLFTEISISVAAVVSQAT